MNNNYNTFAEAYSHILNECNNSDLITSPRNLKIKELINKEFSINNPYSSIYENKKRSTPLKYLSGEFLWYFSGRNDLEFIKRFSKFWEGISNSDYTLNSAYGYLLFKKKNEHGITQWDWAKRSLKEDLHTRQAILHFNSTNHQYENNKDFVCTIYGVFFIRNHTLNFSVYMRSNDMILGLPMDVPFFCQLQIEMWKELKKTYPELNLGKYTHYANSLHIYENKWELVDEMLKYDFIPKFLPQTTKNLPLNRSIFSIIDSIEKDYPLIQGNDQFLNWIKENIDKK